MSITENDNSTRIQKRTELRRQYICEVATRLFRQYGYKSTTLEMIADELGYTKANLYNYIKSKEEVLALAVTQVTLEIRTQAETLIQSDLPADKLIREFCHLYISIIYKGPLFTSSLDSPYRFIEGFPELQAEQDKVTRLVRNIIQKGIQDKIFHVPNVKIETRILFFTINYLPEWYNPKGKLTLEQIINQMADIIIGGLINPQRN